MMIGYQLKMGQDSILSFYRSHPLRSLLYRLSIPVIPAWTAGMAATGMYKDFHPWRWIPASLSVW